MARAVDHRRGTAHERGYGARWQKARKHFLGANPLCWPCESEGQITPAQEVDHVIPHQGDMERFWDTSNWQPICRACHQAKTRRERKQHYRRPACNVVVVCGPPGAGKSHYVRHNYPDARVIDIAVIKAQLSGQPIHQNTNEYIPEAIDERRRQIDELADASPNMVAVIETLAPEAAVRHQWRETTGGKTVVLETEPYRCLRNIEHQPERKAQPMEYWKELVLWWHQRYIRDNRDEIVRG